MIAIAATPDATLLTLLGAVFVASLLGSIHCAGMCGGLLVFAVADPDALSQESKAKKRAPHAAYHLGRAISYATLGALAGSLGAAIDLGGQAVGLQQAAAYLAGGSIVLVGIFLLLRTIGVLQRPGSSSRLGSLRKPIEQAYRIAMKLTPTRRAAAIGLLTPLLPCGWLYAFAITSSATASPISGGLVMLVFWFGTVPLMLAIGLGLGAIAKPLGRFSPTLTATAIVCVGLYTALARGPMPEASAAALLSDRPTDTASAVNAARSTTPDVCPLCEDDESS